MSSRSTYFVTTPIYYVTAKPHLGSLYSTMLADVLARWQVLNGKQSFFLTGTDEHGQKIADAADKAGKEPKAFVDSFIGAYQDAWAAYDIRYDHFIRTTNPHHKAGAQAFIKKLIDTGDIYKDTYEGWYCTPCETFVTQKEAEHKNQAPACPSCERETVRVSEETYFFKLSAYQDKLLKFYEQNSTFIVPKERGNEVFSFVKEGLKDLSLSRTTVKWGVPFPNDAEHTIYVWAEALCNYITAIGYGQPGKESEFNKWWPADMHVLGKDIVRFHGVFWPAFLMAAELPLPKQLLVHGWIKIDKEKMSKSRGNVVDPMKLKAIYGADAVRYYLCRQIPINQDGDFSIADLEQRIGSELANDLGNLLNRMTALAEKNGIMKVPPSSVWQQAALDLRDEAWNMIENFEGHMDDCMFHLAIARVWKFINLVNAYFHGQEPWKLAKVNKTLFIEVLSATCHSLRIIAVLLWPVMPYKMTELMASLGKKFEPKNNTIENLELGSWHRTFMVTKGNTLFEKPEPQQEAKSAEQEAKPAPQQNYIKIDDVAKVELLIGTIEECEEVEGSEKLLKSQVNFGVHGKRQILSGIKQWYKPTDLIGKQGVFVFNLKPRKMMGIESQGMMLLAEGDDDSLKMATVAAPVPNGTRLR